MVVQYFASNQNSYHVSSSLVGTEDKDLMCIKHGPCESLLPKSQAVGTPRDEVNLFECSISEGDLALEDISELILDDDDDDNIIDKEG